MHPVGSELLTLKGESVKLCKLSKKGDTTFFNEKYGSYVDKLDFDLPFNSNLLFTQIGEVSEKLTTKNVNGCIFWIDREIITTANNKKYKTSRMNLVNSD